MTRAKEGVVNVFSWKRILFEAWVIIWVSIIGALLFNHLRPNGMVLWGRLNAAQDTPVSSPAIIGDSGASPSTVAKETAQALFKSRSVVFVDARASESYRQGHIPGAVSLPLGRIDEKINGFLSNHSISTPIVTYCSGVNCGDAAHLAALLSDFGYTRVAVFTGGMEAWRNEGLPVE
jgi:rhodanese-related sulfurtransferase